MCLSYGTDIAALRTTKERFPTMEEEFVIQTQIGRKNSNSKEEEEEA